MSEHDLKTWPEPFEAVWHDRKRYEIRKNDRGFKVGDVLVLREWDPTIVCMWDDPSKSVPRGYSGRVITTEVEYMTDGGVWGLPQGLCVMSIRTIEKLTPLGAKAGGGE